MKSRADGTWWVVPVSSDAGSHAVWDGNHGWLVSIWPTARLIASIRRRRTRRLVFARWQHGGGVIIAALRLHWSSRRRFIFAPAGERNKAAGSALCSTHERRYEASRRLRRLGWYGGLRNHKISDNQSARPFPKVSLGFIGWVYSLKENEGHAFCLTAFPLQLSVVISLMLMWCFVL